MSRIGFKPIKIPAGVKININNNLMNVEGPKGKLSQDYKPEVKFNIQENQVMVDRLNESKRAKSMHGLYRNLLNNMIIGVSQGFSRNLQIIGVGYKAEVKGNNLILHLGFAHPVEYPIPNGITVSVDANTKIIVSGINKQQIGQMCAEIRAYKPPEPYKGKGIRYENELVRKKVGKTGVK
ncbi:MAG: 50S ribosomal protein L6 [Spirochaetales bacterium]|nr:50S ribosomal protein L6 [Spirochaetales bacterium]